MHAQTSGVLLLMVGEHSTVVFLHALSAMASLRSSRPDATGALTGLRGLITLMLASRRLPARERSRIGQAVFAMARTLSSMPQVGKEKSAKYLSREEFSLIMNHKVFEKVKRALNSRVYTYAPRMFGVWSAERIRNSQESWPKYHQSISCHVSTHENYSRLFFQ